MKKLLALPFVFGTALQADTPTVLTDIAPLHGITAAVMQGVGQPKLLIDQSADPHNYALRPSAARWVQDADLILWMGPELTPWLQKTLDNIAPKRNELRFLAIEETALLAARTGVGLSNDHDHDDHEDEHHDDHDDEHHDDHKDEHHDDHEDEHHEELTHKAHHDKQDNPDPHAWLSPENAGRWAHVIADDLAKIDPENAAQYQANAMAFSEGLVALTGEIHTELKPVTGYNYMVFHDAYQYFENSFDIQVRGAIQDSADKKAGAARIRSVQEMVEQEDIHCLLSEPTGSDSILELAIEGHDVGIATVDPLGQHLELGADFYPNLLRDMAGKLKACGP
ncbi:zinc transporter [Amylibacter marinus]|uniref:High-affinity zinc uptake system protein ZnuA n=1 Tax=Amylibacter marinus TaxID=1475483 RepID=A0ABQ5VSH2_9RHOB|nr:zinc ABC transporter substrate-binding protein [Amylibacter marinus]GLQ34207.1 zinc transporter [Amylibacter marinus]